MSRTKYVEYGDQGFWAYDVILGVFLKHLIDAAQTSDQAATDWVLNAIASWRTIACCSDYGLPLDASWSEMQRQSFVAMAEVACLRLGERASIPAEEIVAWPLLDHRYIYVRGAPQVVTAPVVDLGRAIIALVSGTLPDAPPGTTWFYTAAGRRTIGLLR